jgi:hypothetical protein
MLIARGAMANLEKRLDRKDWLRRGIWAGETIIVHGQHGSDASYMWGETDGTSDPPDGLFSGCKVAFRTASGIRGKYDIRGLRVHDTHHTIYLKLPESGLSPKARRWLLVAERLSKKLTDAAIRQSRIDPQAR